MHGYVYIDTYQLKHASIVNQEIYILTSFSELVDKVVDRVETCQVQQYVVNAIVSCFASKFFNGLYALVIAFDRWRR
jgi:hypothetical protein